MTNNYPVYAKLSPQKALQLAGDFGWEDRNDYEDEDIYLIAMEQWEEWLRTDKFEGLEIPQAYTASMVRAINAIDEYNILDYKSAMTVVMSWGSTAVTRDQRVRFINAYAEKSGTQFLTIV
jgi:hypothetical protein